MSDYKDQVLGKAVDEHLHSRCYEHAVSCKDKLYNKYKSIKEGRVPIEFPCEEDGAIPHNIKGDNTKLIDEVIQNCWLYHGAMLACDYSSYDSSMKTNLWLSVKSACARSLGDIPAHAFNQSIRQSLKYQVVRRSGILDPDSPETQTMFKKIEVWSQTQQCSGDQFTSLGNLMANLQMQAVVVSILNACEPQDLQNMNTEKLVGIGVSMAITAEGDDMVNSTQLLPSTVKKWMKPDQTEMEATREMCVRMQNIQTRLCTMWGMACTPEFHFGEDTIWQTEFCGVKVNPNTNGAEQKISNIMKRGYMANPAEFDQIDIVTRHALSIINSMYLQNQSQGFTEYVKECAIAWKAIIAEAAASGQFKKRPLSRAKDHIIAMSNICGKGIAKKTRLHNQLMLMNPRAKYSQGNMLAYQNSETMANTAAERSGFWLEVASLVAGRHHTQDKLSLCGPFVTIPEVVYGKHHMKAQDKVKTYLDQTYRGTALAYTYYESVGDTQHYVKPPRAQKRYNTCKKLTQNQRVDDNDAQQHNYCGARISNNELMKQTKAYKAKSTRRAKVSKADIAFKRQKRQAEDKFGVDGLNAVISKANKAPTVSKRKKTDSGGQFRRTRVNKAAKQVPSSCGGAGNGA